MELFVYFYVVDCNEFFTYLDSEFNKAEAFAVCTFVNAAVLHC